MRPGKQLVILLEEARLLVTRTGDLAVAFLDGAQQRGHVVWNGEHGGRRAAFALRTVATGAEPERERLRPRDRILLAESLAVGRVAHRLDVLPILRRLLPAVSAVVAEDRVRRRVCRRAHRVRRASDTDTERRVRTLTRGAIGGNENGSGMAEVREAEHAARSAFAGELLELRNGVRVSIRAPLFASASGGGNRVGGLRAPVALRAVVDALRVAPLLVDRQRVVRVVLVAAQCRFLEVSQAVRRSQLLTPAHAIVGAARHHIRRVTSRSAYKHP